MERKFYRASTPCPTHIPTTFYTIQLLCVFFLLLCIVPITIISLLYDLKSHSRLIFIIIFASLTYKGFMQRACYARSIVKWA